MNNEENNIVSDNSLNAPVPDTVPTDLNSPVTEPVQNNLNNPITETMPNNLNNPVPETMQYDLNAPVPETMDNSSEVQNNEQPINTDSNPEPTNVEPLNEVPTTDFNMQPKVTIDTTTVTPTNDVVSPIDKPKKKSPLVFILIFVFLILASVGGFFGYKMLSKEKVDRTLMIYMVGADLESQGGIATADLDGLDYKKLKANGINVIAMVGGSKKWYNNYIDKSSTSIYELTESGFKEVKKQTKTNMGQSDTLSEFLTYGYENYKTSEYDLLLWNHGGGIFGAEMDELYRSDALNLKEFETALKKSPFNKDNKLELVIFRTCLNGMLEVASTFKDYSDYMVASEETTSGFHKASLFTYLNDISSTDDGVDFGKKFIDGYMEYNKTINKLAKNTKGEDYVTYSLLDLSKVSNLETSVNKFFSDIDITKNYNKIASVRSNLYQYGYDSSESAAFDSVDLYNLVDGIKDLSSNSNEVLNNINSVVIYSKSPDSKSKGLSIYFPYNGQKKYKDSILSNLYTVNSLSDYKNFITKFNSMQTTGKKSTFSTSVTNLTPTENSNYDFEFTLTDEQLETYANAEYMVIRDNKDGTYKQVYNSTNVELEGNKLKATVKGKQLDVVSKDSNESFIINVYEKNNTDDYIEYVTYPILEYMPVGDLDSLQNWKIQKAKMSLILDKKTNEITIGKVSVQPKNYSSTDSETSDGSAPEPYNVQVDINDYDAIVFGSTSFNMFDENGKYTSDWDSDGTFKGFELKPEELSFKLDDFSSEEEYYAVFAIYDTYNNVYFSDKVKMN